jgi:phage-related protein
VNDAEKIAGLCWHGDSLKVLKDWPDEIQHTVGFSLQRIQEGAHPPLNTRAMSSIAPGAFELKESDAAAWYRVVYMARIQNTIHVLHCFTKKSGKTSQRDLDLARKRWKELQAELQSGGKR